MTLTSMTDAVAELSLLPLARALAQQLPPQARRRAPTRMVFCKALRLEGDWGVVEFMQIVPWSHAAVAEFPDWFDSTSIG